MNNIRKYRRLKGKNLFDMAEEIGISYSYLSSLENEIRVNPTYETIIKLLDYFQCSFEDLFLRDSCADSNNKLNLLSTYNTEGKPAAIHLSRNSKQLLLYSVNYYIEKIEFNLRNSDTMGLVGLGRAIFESDLETLKELRMEIFKVDSSNVIFLDE